MIFKMNINYYISRLNKSITTTLIISILTAAGIATGIAPKLSLQTGKIFVSNNVLAQTPDSGVTKKFAAALEQIESHRQDAINKIQRIVGPRAAAQLACHKPETIGALPDKKARRIAENFCKKSEQIVKNNGLTRRQFNHLARELQSNPAFRQEVQRHMR